MTNNVRKQNSYNKVALLTCTLLHTSYILCKQEMYTTIIQNVVVVSQPSATEPHVVTVEPNDHLLFAAITFVICALLGSGIALIFLIPALFLSQAVSLLHCKCLVCVYLSCRP